MSKLNIENAEKAIAEFFKRLPTKVHRQADLAKHLESQRLEWGLANQVTTRNFIRFLMEAGWLEEVVFPFPAPYKREARYLWGDVPHYEVIQALRPKAYFSHYTAIKFHGLTEQLPKTIYLNVEQPNSGVATSPLTQRAIDAAFRRPARMSGNVAEVRDFRVCIVSGKNTGNLGVMEEVLDSGTGPVRFTNLERTLIDAAVRPEYAGGVFEVRKAFTRARTKLSPEAMAALLARLAYTYPYHQAIGYYLERTGFPAAELERFKQRPMEFDFYLTHQMSQTDYVKEWRLFVPKGF